MLMPCNAGGFRVIIVLRFAILATAGREIVTNEPGTLGGFFKDNNIQTFSA